ncbi:MAG: Ribosome-binding factor A [Wolbachia endosymbiont of Ctenocephalides orientis wCori]|nr:MAG: Ribosome-binding factor A [Wolbachia endosymbiont of Ctenocephalides orientis wCori]
MRKEIRSLKIASVLHRAISVVLTEGKVFNKKILISEVKLSRDLKKADVYVVLSSLNTPTLDTGAQLASRIGDQSEDYDVNSVVNEMNKSAWLIRKSILCHVDLRFIPELIFKSDLGFNNFVNVNNILDKYTS